MLEATDSFNGVESFYKFLKGWKAFKFLKAFQRFVELNPRDKAYPTKHQVFHARKVKRALFQARFKVQS